jgi:hypothetical protein
MAAIEACLSRDPQARPNITALLPALHCFITSGPHMWPEGFDPMIVVD